MIYLVPPLAEMSLRLLIRDVALSPTVGQPAVSLYCAIPTTCVVRGKVTFSVSLSVRSWRGGGVDAGFSDPEEEGVPDPADHWMGTRLFPLSGRRNVDVGRGRYALE